MTNKNPYEVRLEILKMAQDMLLQNYYSTKERIMNNWQAEVETARIRNETPPLCPDFGEFPTEQHIVEKAQFLSEYVNNKV